jgi:uncharacterized protein
MRVSLFLNHACNLRCAYCYNGRKFSRPMSWDIAERGVGLSLASEGPRHVSFFGGEPLLEIDLMRRIIALGRERAGRSIHFSVVTNATLLDARTLDELLGEGVNVAVSLDGGPEAQDITRRRNDGSSSWDAASTNARRLFVRRPWSKVIAVFDPRNVHLLAGSFDALLSLGARNISLNANYEGDWDSAALARFHVAFAQLGDRWVAAWKRGTPFSLNVLDSKILTHLKGGYAAVDRCDFGLREVCVSPAGRLYPCDRLVGEDTRDDVVIGDVWSGVDPIRRDALIARKHTLAQDCAECELARRCMNWCGCVNYATTGDVGGVSGLVCAFERRFIAEADRVAGVLFAEQNPGFLRRFYGCRPPATPAG